MENNPRKSKALIIAIIVIIFLLIVGFLVYKNRDNFGEKSGSTISKIFSPLVPSTNSKNLNSIDENSEKIVAQAGEDIKAGDNVSLSGTDANNNPIVVKAGRNSNIYGFAGQDIFNGELGEVFINNNNSNNFWNTFSDFLDNLFGDDQGDMPPGGWSFDNDLDIWVFDPNGIGGWVFDPNIGGWVPPGGSGEYNPQCSDNVDNDNDGQIDINDPNCHVGGVITGNYLPNHYSESNNPSGGGVVFEPQCSDTLDNDTDGQIDINDPNCHTGGTLEGVYLPNHYSESNDPFGGWEEPISKCEDEIDNDRDGLIDELDPACHIGGNIENEYLPNHDSEADARCENGASNPPICTIFEKEKIPDLTAGAISPTSVLSGAETTISAPISNIGEGGTIYNFSSFFTITNQGMGDTELSGDDNVISKSKFNKFLSKIFKKGTWISMVKAATTGDTEVIINVELITGTPKMDAGETKIITSTYSFNTPGMYYVRACADKDSAGNRGVIDETNEDNNCGPWTAINSTSSLPPPGEMPKCSDGIDNDRDRLIDDLDPACHIDGDLDNAYVSTHDSEATAPDTIFECNDEIDNDTDNKIDEEDPQCHINGDLGNDYVAEHDSETTSPFGSDNEEENICLAVQQNPLVFTDEEESELAELLRKFYLLAPNLKSEDDISLIYNEIERYKEFIGQLTNLTNQCYSQINTQWDDSPVWEPGGNLQGLGFDDNGDGIYEIGLKRFENPWFKGKEKAWDQQYFDYNLIDTKMVSGYFSGTTREFKLGNEVIVEAGLDCDSFTPRPSSGYDFFRLKRLPPFLIEQVQFGGWNSPSDCSDNNYGQLPGADSNPEWAVCSSEAIYAGCKWNGGTTYREVELMLNVW